MDIITQLRTNKILAQGIGLLLAVLGIVAKPLAAQQIIPNKDGTGTIVTPDGNRLDIHGGSLSGDGQNLFHSFQQFGLDVNQIANFLSNPNIRNILSRVNGGDPSIINGLIQVSGGSANLYIMNPAGILFGEGARLNVGGDFTATTATSIGLGDNWFNAFGTNNYQSLVGNPHSFSFNRESGTVVNAGELAVGAGKSLTLAGSRVFSSGNLQAPEGNIIIAAVPGENLLRISIPGHLLSLEVPLEVDEEGNIAPITPEMLLDGIKGSGFTVQESGGVVLADEVTAVPTVTGSAVVGGTVSSHGVSVLGERIGLYGAEVQGDEIKIGGDIRGEGSFPTAQRVYISEGTSISIGLEGEVVVYSDEVTVFAGEINAPGGFVELSGNSSLALLGSVTVGDGTVLIDPRDINIVSVNDDVGNNDGALDDSQILVDEGGTDIDFTITDAALTALDGDIILEASQDIIATDTADLTFTNQTAGETISFTAGRNISINTDISTNGGSIDLTAEDGNINTNGINPDGDNGGDRTLNSTGDITTGNIFGGNITLNSAANIDTSAGTLDSEEAPIVAADDGTGSIVTVNGTTNGTTFDLTGGLLSSNGENLFHSYSRFDLPQTDQIANFIASSEQVNNILGRISSGDASVIEGTIQVTGSPNANLFLLNPAGIVFGQEAQLDVPGDFTATTANGVNFGENLFSASGDFSHDLLNGTPNILTFNTTEPGALLNQSDLTNNNGSLRIIGGTVISPGALSIAGSEIVVGSVPVGNSFSLESNSITELPASLPNEFSANILSLEELASEGGFDGNLGEAGDLTVADISSSGGNTTLVSGGNIDTTAGTLNSGGSSEEDGGSVSITATGDITTGSIETASGDGGISQGDIDIATNGDIIIDTINSQSQGNGARLTISSSNGEITVNDGIDLGSDSGTGGIIELTAQGDITLGGSFFTDTGTQDAGEIRITSQEGNINSIIDNPANIVAAATQDFGLIGIPEGTGGTIVLQAEEDITVNDISAFADIAESGNITLSAEGDIEVGSINAQGGSEGRGGDVEIATSQSFRVTDTFIDQNNVEASISTAGATEGGDISIEHGQATFTVGDASTNGTAGAITNGELTIFPITTIQGNLDFDDFDLEENPPIPPVDIEKIPVVTAPALVTSNNISQVELEPKADDLDEELTKDYETYLAKEIPQEVTLEEAQAILQEIESAVNAKPALIYSFFSPTSTKLKLVLVTSEGEAIELPIEGASRGKVLRTATRFRDDIQAVLPVRGILPNAQQLYQWLIAPLEAELQARGIDNLVFIMDEGLRSLPLAALHDGEQYLVEKYSVGLMPSLSLTDTSYGDLKNASVLAMGASEFAELNDLPAVSQELATIDELWEAETFLNEDFTIANLKEAREKKAYGIIHLATHGEFESGNISNSYIQFRGERLSLDRLRELGLNNPPLELLVLSACKTALGDEEAELGFAGLAHQAGVKSALGSLWYVSDAGTLGLMSTFYDELQQAPIKAEALRQAQLAMISGDVKLVGDRVIIDRSRSLSVVPEVGEPSRAIGLNHPYYWSAFTMIGNPW